MPSLSRVAALAGCENTTSTAACGFAAASFSVPPTSSEAPSQRAEAAGLDAAASFGAVGSFSDAGAFGDGGGFGNGSGYDPDEASRTHIYKCCTHALVSVSLLGRIALGRMRMRVLSGCVCDVCIEYCNGALGGRSEVAIGACGGYNEIQCRGWRAPWLPS